jgi:hypothetical protein
MTDSGSSPVAPLRKSRSVSSIDSVLPSRREVDQQLLEYVASVGAGGLSVRYDALVKEASRHVFR